MAATLSDRLASYLRDAHAMEVEGLQIAERAHATVAHPQLEQLYLAQLVDLRDHERCARERLDACGATVATPTDPSARSAALCVGLAASVLPDGPAAMAIALYAFRSLEIVVWETIRRIAERAGDGETVRAAERIVMQSRAARTEIAAYLDLAIEDALSATT
jgi:ferritin-like metal-binding protein YciE